MTNNLIHYFVSSLSLLLLNIYLSNTNIVFAQNIKISATLEGSSIYGFTSPNSQLQLDSNSHTQLGKSNKNGYFYFNLVSDFDEEEICLTSKDTNRRSTHPVCIPISRTKLNKSIGPVILPPTISLDKKNYFMADKIYLTGKTIPNTNVHIYIFNDERGIINNIVSRLNIPSSVYASNFPKINVKSDNKGVFYTHIPSHQTNKLRLISQASFNNELSPQSNSLNLQILPYWLYPIAVAKTIPSFIKNNILLLTIILEVAGLIAFVLNRHLHPNVIVKTKALMLRDREEIVLKSQFDKFIKDEKAIIINKN